VSQVEAVSLKFIFHTLSADDEFFYCTVKVLANVGVSLDDSPLNKVSNVCEL
jgi:hypothetical protein